MEGDDVALWSTSVIDRSRAITTMDVEVAVYLDKKTKVRAVKA